MKWFKTSAAHLKCSWCDRERVLGACGARTRAVAPASLQVPFESHADLRTALYIHFWTSNFHFFDRNPPNGPQKCTIYTLLDTEFHPKSNLHSSKMPSKWSQSAIYSAFWLKGWIHCLNHPVLVGLYSKKEGDRFAVAMNSYYSMWFVTTNRGSGTLMNLIDVIALERSSESSDVICILSSAMLLVFQS